MNIIFKLLLATMFYTGDHKRIIDKNVNQFSEMSNANFIELQQLHTYSF